MVLLPRPFEVLMPGRCACCHLPGDPLCDRCHAELTPLAAPLCGRCGHPWALAVARCAACRRVPPASRQALAWSGPARDLVLDLKDAGVRAAAAPLVAAVVAHTPRPAAALVPLPASPRGRAERGFDQAALIASGLGRAWGLEVRPLLRRRAGPGQRGAPLRRRLALAPAAFTVRRPPRAGEGPVVLVDDVVTTGSSLAAAAAALRAVGWTVAGTRACARVIRAPGRR